MLKILGFTAAALLVVPVAVSLAAAVYLLSGGLAVVSVETPELDLTVPVPVRIVDIGLDVAGLAMPAADRRALAAELPADLRLDLGELARELGRSTDGTLVDVRTPEESVIVRKDGGRMRVEVDAPDARVRVSMPTRGLERMADGVDDLLASVH
jgi:hypothetical protein